MAEDSRAEIARILTNAAVQMEAFVGVLHLMSETPQQQHLRELEADCARPLEFVIREAEERAVREFHG